MKPSQAARGLHVDDALGELIFVPANSAWSPPDGLLAEYRNPYVRQGVMTLLHVCLGRGEAAMWNIFRRQGNHPIPKNVIVQDQESTTPVPFPDHVNGNVAATFLVAVATSVKWIEAQPPQGRQLPLSDLFLTALNIYVDELFNEHSNLPVQEKEQLVILCANLEEALERAGARLG